MKKTFRKYEPGSTEYVIHHCRYMAKRGRNPSASLYCDANPRRALRNAVMFEKISAMCAAERRYIKEIGCTVLESVPIQFRQYRDLDPQTIGALLRAIVEDSMDIEEAKKRIKEELGYEGEPIFHVFESISKKPQALKDLFLVLGGAMLKSGDMVRVTVISGQGETVTL